MTRNSEWPPGILSRVSREAYNAIRRGRAFPFQTPEKREEAARSYDELFNRGPMMCVGSGCGKPVGPGCATTCLGSDFVGCPSCHGRLCKTTRCFYG